MTRLLLLLPVLLAGCATPPDAAARLKADLLAQPSATQVLTQWCGALHLASPAAIRAERDPAADPTPPPGARELLKVGPGEVLGYRRVKLACGAHVLSEADNWYVPARLTPAMNRTLETSDTPFGTVVRPLDFHRRTLEAAPRRGATILKVRALLLTPDEVPFSLVVENYTRALAP